MECPKCKASNSDDAVCCSLCFENFKAKPKPASSAHRWVVFGETATTLEKGWVSQGPLVITEKGFYWFVKAFVQERQKGFGEALQDKLGDEFGVLGDLAGAAIKEAVSSGEEASWRPEKILLQPTADLMEHLQDVLSQAPDIPACKEYFTFQKAEITKVEYDGLSNLELTTQWLKLEIGAPGDEARVSAYLKSKGYAFSE